MPLLEGAPTHESLLSLAKDIARAAQQAAVCEQANLYLVRADGDEIELVASSPEEPTAAAEKAEYAPIAGVTARRADLLLAEHVHETAEATVLDTRSAIAEHQVFASASANGPPDGWQTYLAVPIALNKRRIGVLEVRDGRPGQVTYAFLDTAGVLANFVSLAYVSIEEIRRREEFAQLLAHELGSPLNAVAGIADEIATRFLRYEPVRLGPALGAQDGWAVDVAEAGSDPPVYLMRKAVLQDYSDHLAHIAAHMLTVISPDRDYRIISEYSADTVQLTSRAELVRRCLAHAARKRYLELIPDYGRRVTSIVGDEGFLSQATYNVVWNAIKYSRPNGEVRLSVVEEGDVVALTVSDEGIGFSDLAAEHAFDMGFRSTEAKKHDARGLGRGLSVAYTIVTNHGGTITIEHRRSPTVVRMVLPVVARFARVEEE